MKCLCVCHEKWSLPTSKLSARGAKWAARQALPGVGRHWPYDDDDDQGAWDGRIKWNTVTPFRLSGFSSSQTYYWGRTHAGKKNNHPAKGMRFVRFVFMFDFEKLTNTFFCPSQVFIKTTIYTRIISLKRLLVYCQTPGQNVQNLQSSVAITHSSYLGPQFFSIAYKKKDVTQLKRNNHVEGNGP